MVQCKLSGGRQKTLDQNPVDAALSSALALTFKREGTPVLAKVPKLDAQHAGLQAVSVGQVAIGPITVGQLVLNGTDFSMSGAHGVLRNVGVTVTLHISVEWHIHIGLPDGIPDIDVGDTYDLGSFSFSMPVGDIVIPALNNVHVNIPNLTAQNISASASPLSLQLGNVAAEQIEALDATLPTAGFTITGLTLSSVVVNGIDVPAANISQTTVGHLHGDPLKIPVLTLGGLNLPTVQIPLVNSSAPLDIPATLQERSVGFDAGILRLAIHIQPSALSHIDHLEITGANASATASQIVLHDVTLPYDALNLTLSQIGIDTIDIPAFTV
jgi:hypothetical protein